MNLCSAAVDHPLGFCFLRWPLYEQDPKAERKLEKEFEFSSLNFFIFPPGIFRSARDKTSIHYSPLKTLSTPYFCFRRKICQQLTTSSLKEYPIFKDRQNFSSHQRSRCPAFEASKFWQNKRLCYAGHFLWINFQRKKKLWSSNLVWRAIAAG